MNDFDELKEVEDFEITSHPEDDDPEQYAGDNVEVELALLGFGEDLLDLEVSSEGME